MAVPTVSRMSKTELHLELQSHLSVDHAPGERDAYEFDIRIPDLRVPREVRWLLTGEEIDLRLQEFYKAVMEGLASSIKRHEGWVRGWKAMEGWRRMVLVAHDQVAEVDVPLGVLRKRLTVLRKLDAAVASTRVDMERHVALRSFWDVEPLKQDWSPRN